jgi:hypothetical protein
MKMNMVHPPSFPFLLATIFTSNTLLVGYDTAFINPFINYSHEKKCPTCNMAMHIKHPNVFSKQHPSSTINR